MIDTSGIGARIERLDSLTQGLGREVGKVQGEDMQLASHEQRAYVVALLDAVMGLDAARAVLVRVHKRLGGGAGG